jgi:DHA1 family bicyclomycin/chloramphenicol resistance-like MFS transporter
MSGICMVSQSMEMLIVSRAVQGLAAAVGPVVGRAIIRDVSSGRAGAVMMSTVASMIALAPLLAPMIGSGLMLFYSWHVIFLFMLVFAIASMAALRLFMRETLAPERRHVLTFGRLRKNIGIAFAERHFRYGFFLIIFSFAGYLTFIASSSPLLIDVYGVPREKFGFVFAIVAVFLAIGSSLSTRLVHVWGIGRMLRVGVTALGAAALLLGALAFVDMPALPLLMAGFCLYLLGMGIVLPNSFTVALEPVPSVAGTAASLLGAGQIGGGAIASAVAAALYAHNHVVTCAAMSFFGALSVVWYGMNRHETL